MIKIDTSTLQEGRNLSVIARTAIYGILARVVLIGRASDDQLRTRYYFESIWPRLFLQS